MGYVCNKMKTRENMAPLHKEKGNLIFWDLKKVEVLNNFSVSVFPYKCFSCAVWPTHTEGKGRNWESEELPTIGENQVWDHLKSKRVHKPMEPGKTNLCVLRKLVEKVAKLLSIFEKPQQFGGVPSAW